MDISFNQIGDRGMVAVSDAFKENQKLEVFNILGNDFTDKSIRFLGEAMNENKKSKMVILKIGSVTCEAATFETFMKLGYDKSPVLKYMYITTNQHSHPIIQKIADTEGENPKTLIVTENYDSKIDSPMIIDLMTQISELEIFQGGDM